MSSPESEGLRLARNSAFLGVAQVVSLLLGFVTTIVVTDQLGKESYGLFLGAQRFVLFFAMVMQFGLHPLTVRAIAGRTGDPAETVGTVLALRCGLAPIFVGVVLGIAFLSDYLPDHRWLLGWLIAVEVVGVFAESYLAVLEGYERMDAAGGIWVLRSIATAVGVAAVAAIGGGLMAFVLVYLVARAVQLAAVVIVATRMLPTLRFRWNRAGELLREAIPFVAIGVAFMARNNLDVVLLTRLSTIPEVSLYGAAFNFLSVMLALPLLVQRALLPALSRLHTKGGAAGMAQNTIAVVSAILLPAGVGIYLLAEGIMGIYPSAEFSEGVFPLQILAGSLPFLAPTMIAATLLTGAGRIWPVVYCNVGSLVVQAVVSLLLISTYGAAGAAIGLLASSVSAAILFALTARPLGLRMPVASLARHGIATLAMAAALSPFIDQMLALPVVVGAVVYAAVLLLISPSDSLERRLPREALSWAKRIRSR